MAEPTYSEFPVGLTTTEAPFIEQAVAAGQTYIEQPYELYSEENHDSWRRLYARMLDRWGSGMPTPTSWPESATFASIPSASLGWKTSTSS